MCAPSCKLTWKLVSVWHFLNIFHIYMWRETANGGERDRDASWRSFPSKQKPFSGTWILPGFPLNELPLPLSLSRHISVFISISEAHMQLYMALTLSHCRCLICIFIDSERSLALSLPYSLASHKIPIKMSTHKQPAQARKPKAAPISRLSHTFKV